MPARKYLTIDDIRPYIPRVENRELTRAELARELGVSLPTLQRELKRLDIKLRHKRSMRPLHVRLLELFTEEQLRTLSQYEIAKQLKIKQPNISKALKQLGIKRETKYDSSQRDELCEQVVNHIMEHGGYVESTIRKLGVNIYKNAVYTYCRERGIDLRLYRMAYRRFGHWLTLPCLPEPCYTRDYLIKAECTKCGSVHTVQIVNLQTGASTQCRSCSNKERTSTSCCRSVVCIETKEKTRSVRTLAKKLGVNYAKLLAKLKRDGDYKYDGLTYRLV